jgi:hypothetical protein
VRVKDVIALTAGMRADKIAGLHRLIRHQYHDHMSDLFSDLIELAKFRLGQAEAGEGDPRMTARRPSSSEIDRWDEIVGVLETARNELVAIETENVPPEENPSDVPPIVAQMERQGYRVLYHLEDKPEQWAWLERAQSDHRYHDVQMIETDRPANDVWHLVIFAKIAQPMRNPRLVPTKDEMKRDSVAALNLGGEVVLWLIKKGNVYWWMEDDGDRTAVSGYTIEEAALAAHRKWPKGLFFRKSGT